MWGKGLHHRLFMKGKNEFNSIEVKVNIKNSNCDNMWIVKTQIEVSMLFGNFQNKLGV